jgi:hypothetical protein
MPATIPTGGGAFVAAGVDVAVGMGTLAVLSSGDAPDASAPETAGDGAAGVFDAAVATSPAWPALPAAWVGVGAATSTRVVLSGNAVGATVDVTVTVSVGASVGVSVVGGVGVSVADDVGGVGVSVADDVGVSVGS